MTNEESGGRADFEIIIDPSQQAGVWANFASVSHSDYEFTLDFVRLDFGNKKGIVVARVSVSPLFITQLIEALNQNWTKYAKRALPKEVYGNELEDGISPDEGEDPLPE